jgi:putative membrane protein
VLLVCCVDRDDDLGRKAGVETPVIGRDAVEAAAVSLATADPEDSDANVLFQGLQAHDRVAESGESVAVAAVTGTEGGGVGADRVVGEELDAVLARLETGEPVTALVVTDGAQDESVLPAIRSRVTVDGVRRVVVRQAEDLESLYYTIRQVLDDPETRGTILAPLGILLLIYPLVVLANLMDLPGATVFGLLSAMLGLYVLARGLGVEDRIDAASERLRQSLYAGRVTIITTVVGLALLVMGGIGGYASLQRLGMAADPLSTGTVVAALVDGALPWFGAAGIVSSVGRILDSYLDGSFEWRYLNAPFYVLSIVTVLHAVSGYALAERSLAFVAAALAAGTILGLLSTLTFAVAETRLDPGVAGASRPE